MRLQGLSISVRSLHERRAMHRVEINMSFNATNRAAAQYIIRQVRKTYKLMGKVGLSNGSHMNTNIREENDER